MPVEAVEHRQQFTQLLAIALNPNNLPSALRPGVGTWGHDELKLWKDIWAAGQGVGNIDEVMTVAELVDRLEDEYRDAHPAHPL